MRFLSDFQTLCLQIGFPFLPPLLVFLRHVQPKGAGRRLRVKLTSLLNIWKIDKKFTTFNVRIIRQITTFSSTIGLTRRRLTNFFWQKLYNFYNQNDSSNYDKFPKNNTKPLWFDDFFGENWFFPLTWQILSSSRFKGKLNIVEQCVSFISIAAWTYQAMPRMTSILSLSPIYTVFEIHPSNHNFSQHLRIFPPFVFS